MSKLDILFTGFWLGMAAYFMGTVPGFWPLSVPMAGLGLMAGCVALALTFTYWKDR